MFRFLVRAMFATLLSAATTALTAGSITFGSYSHFPAPTCTTGPPNCVVANIADRPYWFNVSQDDGVKPPVSGEPRTLASIVRNTSPYTGLPTFSNPEWFGAADGVNPITDLFLTGTGPFDITLLLRETGNNLTLGWYGFDSSGAIVDGGILLDQNTAQVANGGGGQPIHFVPTTNTWGLFVKYGRPMDCSPTDWRAVCYGTVLGAAGGSGVPLDIYYSQAWRNSSSSDRPPLPANATAEQIAAWNRAVFEADLDPNRQHFVFVTTDQGLVVGVEDSWTSLQAYNNLNTPYSGNVWEGKGDFNDLVLLINATAVPEPSTVAMFAIGGLGLLCSGLRRRRASKK